jgi:hypothetical protein
MPASYILRNPRDCLEFRDQARMKDAKNIEKMGTKLLKVFEGSIPRNGKSFTHFLVPW